MIPASALRGQPGGDAPQVAELAAIRADINRVAAFANRCYTAVPDAVAALGMEVTEVNVGGSLQAVHDELLNAVRLGYLTLLDHIANGGSLEGWRPDDH